MSLSCRRSVMSELVVLNLSLVADDPKLTYLQSPLTFFPERLCEFGVELRGKSQIGTFVVRVG